jgi:hypothetical protein
MVELKIQPKKGKQGIFITVYLLPTKKDEGGPLLLGNELLYSSKVWGVFLIQEQYTIPPQV